MTDYRVIVIGMDGIGSAAAYRAARRAGKAVLGIEQFPLGHPNGGSEDHSRIIRLSHHTPGYVSLARAAYRAWSEVEMDSGQQLVIKTGGLDLAPGDAVIGLDSYRDAMTVAGVAFEELDSTAVMSRWPQWQLEDDTTALFQPDAGIVMASKANSAHRAMAKRYGARILEATIVTSVEEIGGEVVVETTDGRFTAGGLIIAAGGWTNQTLAHLQVSFPLELTQEQVVYLTPSANPSAFAADRFPIWIWMTVPSFYGFPLFGEPAVKLSWDRCEIVTDVDNRSHVPRQDVIDAVTAFATARLPDAAGDVHLSKTCLYTLTPDRDFIVDRVPGTENVYMAVGAGHAFKFASLLGSILVELAIDGETEQDISPFAADRAALTHPAAERNYLI
ncbi:MAG: N-methyl-L-tryptophan oxidase [Acidimicrobiia bacterium]